MRHSLLVGAVIAAELLGSPAARAQRAAHVQTIEITSTEPAPRPRLGVRVDIRPRPTDSIGAFVEAVTPGSPAERAGVRAGDVIAKVGGRPIGSTDEQQSAGLRLVRIATRLKPNATVSVELRRGERRKTVSVVTPEEITLVFQGSPDDSARRWSFRIQPTDSEAAGGQGILRWLASPLAALETASLNPELGQYFGTTEGVLVIKSPPESRLKLKGGDVVLAVNGRQPADPADFIRLLQDHQPSTPLRLSILRHRKRTTLTIQLNGKNTR